MKTVEGQLHDLPDGWIWTTLEDISEINPKFDGDDVHKDTEVSFLPMRCVTEMTGKLDLSESRPIHEVRKGYTHFAEGDLLFAKITPCMENGKAGVARGLRSGLGFGSTEFHVIRFRESILPELYFYYLIQEGVRREARRNMTGSAGQLRVPTTYFRQIPVPLPPLAEQHCIVAKIEELFTKLHSGVESLKFAREQLIAYRESVLNEAVTGKLTQRWREEHKSDLEPTSILEARILKERRRSWEEHSQSRDTSLRYREPVDSDSLAPVKLPLGWTLVSFDSLLREPLRNGHSAKASDTGDGVRTLTLTAVTEGDFSERNTKLTVANARDVSDLWLRPGDILIERSNTPGLVGINRVYRGPEDFAIFPDLVIRARTLDIIPLSFVEIILNSATTRRYFRAQARSTSGSMPKINQAIIRKLPVPLPPLGEQIAIVEWVERSLSIVTEVQKVVEANLARSQHLRQSILTDAFSGKLVAQDPGDEPASVLLKKIKKQIERPEAKDAQSTASQARVDAFQRR